MSLSSTLPVRPAVHDPALAGEPFSGEDLAGYFRLLARLKKVSFTTRAESGLVHVEMEIALHGVVVLKTEARLDAAGFERLQGLMAAASLLEW